jgi:hypothetical protein
MKDKQKEWQTGLKEKQMKTYTVTVKNNGTIRWYKEGTEELHREDGPAVEYTNGSKYWYLNDECHREDGPAIEYSNGSKFWYLNGELHREDGPAIEYSNGSKFWYLNGECHREDGPACKYNNGDKFWYLNGERHREDGPAIEWNNGNKAWYLNGKYLPEKEWRDETTKRNNSTTCKDKMVVVDGVEYKLVPISGE